MIYLRELHVPKRMDGFPFVGAISPLDLLFTSDVTILVGENGTGKSTLLEALARKMALPSLGKRDAAGDDTLQAVQPLQNAMKTVYNLNPHKGFFLRAEDFFGYLERISQLQAEMRGELERVGRENAHRSRLAQVYAAMAYASSLGDMNHSHGENPDACSHGEGFMRIFEERIRPGGIYLMDEPEAALSPVRQLALLSMVMQMKKDAQFIIATHSPILSACPNADVWSLDYAPARQVQWNELESIQILRDFLNAPERFLKQL